MIIYFITILCRYADPIEREQLIQRLLSEHQYLTKKIPVNLDFASPNNDRSTDSHFNKVQASFTENDEFFRGSASVESKSMSPDVVTTSDDSDTSSPMIFFANDVLSPRYTNGNSYSASATKEGTFADNFMGKELN